MFDEPVMINDVSEEIADELVLDGAVAAGDEETIAQCKRKRIQKQLDSLREQYHDLVECSVWLTSLAHVATELSKAEYDQTNDVERKLHYDRVAVAQQMLGDYALQMLHMIEYSYAANPTEFELASHRCRQTVDETVMSGDLSVRYEDYTNNLNRGVPLYVSSKDRAVYESSERGRLLTQSIASIEEAAQYLLDTDSYLETDLTFGYNSKHDDKIFEVWA